MKIQLDTPKNMKIQLDTPKNMKIQLDIPKDINKHLKIERIEKDIPNMSELIIKILEERYDKRRSGRK